MKTKFVLLILILFVIGCASTEKKSAQSDDGAIVIDINSALKGEPRYLEDMIESVELIPLETTEASIVGEGGFCIITDKYIYISDIYENFQGLIIFERNGKFVKRIFRGNGPNELPYFQHVFYTDGYLYVFGGQKLAKFTSGGDFIEYQQFNDLAIDIQKVGDVFLTIQPQFQNYDRKFKVIEYGSDLKKVSEQSLAPIPFPNAFKSLSCVDGINCLVYRFADNNIYNYSNGEFKVKYRLEYPDFEFRLTYEDYEKLPQEEQRISYSYLSKNMPKGQFVFSGYISNCDDYLIVSMLKGLWGESVVYNKNTGKTWKKINCKDDSPSIFGVLGESSNQNQVIGQKNSFYGTIDIEDIEDCWKNNPNNLLSPKDIEILKNAKADDNPIIVIYKLKDNL